MLAARHGGAARGAAVFFTARVAGAGLTLAHLALVAALFPTAAAAHFFVLWTVVWCGSVWLRFGADQLLPRLAARARLSGDVAALGGLPAILARTAPALALALVPVLSVLTPGQDAGGLLVAVPLCLLGASAWAVIVVVAGLLRGYGAIGTSGIVQSVLPAAAVVVGTIGSAPFGNDPLVLLGACVLGLTLAMLVSFFAATTAIGARPVHAALLGRGPRDPEIVHAGLLTLVGEVGLALPVWLAQLADASAADVAGLYAALRVAAVFSWPAGTVAAVATPRLAGAIAAGDLARARHVLNRSVWAATLSSLPFAAVGLFAAGSLLGWLGSEYAPYSAVLAILVAGRLIDACAGPLSETLIVGGRVRHELANLVLFVVVLIAAGTALRPELGMRGLALGVTLGIAACNLPRVVQVWRLLRLTDTARAAPAGTSRARRAIAIVSAVALVDLLVAGGAIADGSAVALAAVLAGTIATFAVAAREARRRAARSWRFVAISPLAGAIGAWGAIFVWRPLSLWLWPSDTTIALSRMGFDGRDLVVAAAIGGLGCAMWTVGYLLALGRPRRPRPLAAAARTQQIATVPAALVLALGTVLWGALFLRQGGISTLVNEPGSIHSDSGSSGYAILGVWLVQGVALHALLGLLRGGGRDAARLFAFATGSSLLAALCLQARGLFVLLVLSSLIVTLHMRRPSRRQAVVMLLVGCVAIPLAVFAQQVRSYSQSASVGDAIQLTLDTPPSTFQISDLSVFDNLVALQELVPRDVPRLNGSTLTAIPTAFVPRALWPEKPLAVDHRMTAILYPGQTSGSPVALQGELYWNFGLPAVVLGALLIGASMGLLARAGLSPRGPTALLLYAVLTASVLAPLTRALAPMVTNTAMAVLGVLLAGAALNPATAMRAAGWWTRVRASIRTGLSAEPATAPTAGIRFRAIDGLRAAAALAIVVVHVTHALDAPDPSRLGNLANALGLPALVVFFGVSGFVLYRPFVSARAKGTPAPRTSDFLTRRAARIVPAYWTLLTIFALAGLAPRVFSEDWWCYYGFAQSYTSDRAAITAGIGPAWTLCVEVSFYLVLVGYARMMERRWRDGNPERRWTSELAALVLLGAIGIATTAYVTFAIFDHPEIVFLAFSLPMSLHWFVIGMVLAVVSVRVEHGWGLPAPLRWVRDHPSACWAFGALCLLGIFAQQLAPTPSNPDPGLNSGSYLLFSALCTGGGAAFVAPVMLGAAARTRPMRVLVLPAVLWVGAVSYGLYLSHAPFVSWIAGAAWLPDALIPRVIAFGAIVLALALTVAALSWYLIERPVLRWVARRRQGSDAGVQRSSTLPLPVRSRA